MLAFLAKHWRGEYTLPRSYWVNGVAITLAALLIIAAATPFLRSLPIAWSIAIALATLPVLLGISVWQLVGIWRSASRTTAETGAKFWPIAAKVVVTIGFLNGTYKSVSTAYDLAQVLSTIREPLLADYQVDQLGNEEIYLTGAINDDSVAQAIRAIESSSATTLWIDSHGGLIEPAMKLARFVRDSSLTVAVEYSCVSACVFVLAGSTNGELYPGATITFHQAAAVIDFATPELRAENERYLAEVDDYYRELSVPQWAIDKVAKEELWAPSLAELAEIGIVDMIYSPELGEFLPAREHCAAHPEQCGN